MSWLVLVCVLEGMCPWHRSFEYDSERRAGAVGEPLRAQPTCGGVAERPKSAGIPRQAVRSWVSTF